MPKMKAASAWADSLRDSPKATRPHHRASNVRSRPAWIGDGPAMGMPRRSSGVRRGCGKAASVWAESLRDSKADTSTTRAISKVRSRPAWVGDGSAMGMPRRSSGVRRGCGNKAASVWAESLRDSKAVSATRAISKVVHPRSWVDANNPKKADYIDAGRRLGLKSCLKSLNKTVTRAQPAGPPTSCLSWGANNVRMFYKAKSPSSWVVEAEEAEEAEEEQSSLMSSPHSSSDIAASSDIVDDIMAGARARLSAAPPARQRSAPPSAAAPARMTIQQDMMLPSSMIQQLVNDMLATAGARMARPPHH